MNIPEELSAPDFAKFARVTRQAVFKMIKEGRVKARKLGNTYIIKRSELERYLAEK